MTAVGQLDDPAGRCAITILRGTGLRLGELLDLELDCVIDYRDHGTWLRVPFGKLNTERTVPLDQPSLDAFDNWANHRGHSRPPSTPARADQSGSWRLFSRVGRGPLGTPCSPWTDLAGGPIVTVESKRETLKMTFEARHVLESAAIRVTDVGTTLVGSAARERIARRMENQTGRARAICAP